LANNTKKNIKKKRGLSVVLYFAFWMMLAAGFAGVTVIQAGRYNTARQEFDRVNEELLIEQESYEELQNQMVYYESDAYIEQMAREQLGYVKPNEIVIVNTPE
jgi:cell division protein FtsB